MTRFPDKLNTQRLTLAPLGIRYLDSAAIYAMDEQTCKYMVWLPCSDIGEIEEFLRGCDAELESQLPRFYECAVTLNGVHIGAVSCYISDDGEFAELGWILNKAYHGNGYASEAAKALMDFCVQNRGVKRFVAHCDAENTASARVMQKLGMVYVGSCGDRRNRLSVEPSRELMYEINI